MMYDPAVAKRRGNHEHLAARLWERYKLPLSSHDLRVMVGRIQERDPTKVKLVATQPEYDILLVAWLGKWILVAWDKRHCRIRTFLPLHAEFAEDGSAMYKKDDPPEWVDEIQSYRETMKGTE